MRAIGVRPAALTIITAAVLAGCGGESSPITSAEGFPVLGDSLAPDRTATPTHGRTTATDDHLQRRHRLHR